MTTEEIEDSTDGVAIIGMAGRFPGAANVDDFWHNIRKGIESITFFNIDELDSPPNYELADENEIFIAAKGLLDDVDKFDARFWGYLPREAATMDPQHRIFLETAWNVLENGGYDSERYDGAIGVYAGCYLDTYLLANLCTDPKFLANLIDSIQVGSLQTELGNDKDYLATRVSHKMNLTGPSINLQSACSTSLVAVAQACSGLQSYHCDMAIAGGVTITLPFKKGYFHKEGGMLSKDGHCRPFDANASGTVFSNASAAVLLKRESEAIADGDTIYAIIKGYGLNNDGSEKLSYTAPSVKGQAEVISLAHAFADIDARTIGYVETHGTATPLGDPIEIAGLTEAFRETTDENQFCAIGSLKGNIGHLDVASGVTGVIKTSLALKDKVLPPSINFTSPNPKIDFSKTPFFVNTSLTPWKSEETPRRAGVSSFGVGGTNAHLVMEEAPEPVLEPGERDYNILPLSATTQESLQEQASNLAQYLKANSTVEMADVAYTLQVGRRVFKHKRIVVCSDVQDAILQLESPPKPLDESQTENADRGIVFMFPGQGAQFPQMTRELYQNEEVYRRHLDECFDIMQPLVGRDMREVLFTGQVSDEEASQFLKQTTYAQPAIFSVEYALAKLWQSWGIRPDCCVGHSVGEFMAACLAGVFTLKEVLELVTIRGRLMQEMPAGAMLSVRKSDEELQPLLSPSLSIAAKNGPFLSVISGTFQDIDSLESRLQEENVPYSRLHTSHAFHSTMMDPVVIPTVEAARKVHMSEPQLPIMSTVTGEWLRSKEVTNPEYWGRNLRYTVNFTGGIEKLANESRIFLEVGPGQTLSTLAKQIIGSNGDSISLPSLGHVQDKNPDTKNILTALSRLWLGGVSIDWQKLHSAKRQRIPLPSYPFVKQKHWVEPSKIHFKNTTEEMVKEDTGKATGNEKSAPQNLSETEKLVMAQIRIMNEQLATFTKKG